MQDVPSCQVSKLVDLVRLVPFNYYFLQDHFPNAVMLNDLDYIDPSVLKRLSPEAVTVIKKP